MKTTITMYNGVKITETKAWSFETVRGCCVRNSYYTCGTNEDYIKMLRKVDELAPTAENVYEIARDILEHSYIEDDLTDIMFCLGEEAITTFYEVERAKGAAEVEQK